VLALAVTAAVSPMAIAAVVTTATTNIAATFLLLIVAPVSSVGDSAALSSPIQWMHPLSGAPSRESTANARIPTVIFV
jgi:hypothetical protein